MSTARIDALTSALAGLSTTQQRIDTISRNVSNASTDGYTLKTQQAVTGPGGVVLGGPIQRAVDATLRNTIRETTGTTSRLEVQVSSLSNIESVLGQPGDGTGLSASITQLQSAFQTLSMQPESTAAYGGVLQAAQSVVSSFHGIADAISTEQSNAQSQYIQAVGDLNATLQDIDNVNKSILQANNTDTTDLEDHRDQLLDKLSGLIEFTSFTKPNGEIAIYTKSGLPLVDQTVHPVDPTQLGAQQPSAGPPVTVVKNGKIGGLLALRDLTLPAAAAQLDDQARAITQEFKTLGIELFNDGGSTTLATAPVNPAQVTGFAGRIEINTAISATPTLIRDGSSATPLQPGDTTFIDQALALFSRNNVAFDTTTGLPAQGSLTKVAADFMAQQGSNRTVAQTELDHQNAVLQAFQQKQAQVSGVSVDDQLSQLVVLQQAYAANARIVQTTQTLLNNLLQAV
jgi:flagellar hook-associated protein 1 FlgK